MTGRSALDYLESGSGPRSERGHADEMLGKELLKEALEKKL